MSDPVEVWLLELIGQGSEGSWSKDWMLRHVRFFHVGEREKEKPFAWTYGPLHLRCSHWHSHGQTGGHRSAQKEDCCQGNEPWTPIMWIVFSTLGPLHEGGSLEIPSMLCCMFTCSSSSCLDRVMEGAVVLGRLFQCPMCTVGLRASSEFK